MNTTSGQETLVAICYKVTTSHTIPNQPYCGCFPSLQVTVLKSVLISA